VLPRKISPGEEILPDADPILREDLIIIEGLYKANLENQNDSFEQMPNAANAFYVYRSRIEEVREEKL
jgi:hypothetical protein